MIDIFSSYLCYYQEYCRIQCIMRYFNNIKLHIFKMHLFTYLIYCGDLFIYIYVMRRIKLMNFKDNKCNLNI